MTRFTKKHILCHDSDIFLRYLIFVENKFLYNSPKQI